MKQTNRSPPFYALNDDLPLILAISSGLQHALAMLAGLITPPIIFASALSLDAETSSYMISASLIGCGASKTMSKGQSAHQVGIRHHESGADVQDTSLPGLLPGHWTYHCRRH